MTMIHSLRWRFTDPLHRRFVAERLAALKAALQREITQGTSERSLRLATWNLMHFGNGGGYRRTPESMLYIAEIIDHFDLVAVQEVNRDLTALDTLVNDHLGTDWDYLVTDTAGGTSREGGPGNHERLAFLYRRGKVHFARETGEIVLPEGQEIAAPGADGVTRHVQFARTPFTVAFRAGWLKFKLCTVHIFYGDAREGSPEMAQRRAEIAQIARFLADRQADEARAAVRRAREDGWVRPEDAGRDANYILLGDFNIVSPAHETMQALEAAGFTVPTALHTTNLGNDHHYDQIAVKAAHPGFAVRNSGVFDMLGHVYRDEDAAFYIDHLKPERIAVDGDGNLRPRDRQVDYFRRYYRRHQMSDHKLLWCEIAIDYADAYLAEIAGA
ncbi:MULTISPECIES: endonuclease/exonuclease/phosphatase family protein [unclassified Sphingomonas]|jgi:endonuclease/exonuclease/phosphatase family metal-dependent hydrolase|uniref:endonuclease/exonuclease/phosphatase family protein n=1 Tax=unclassified Sphingomonas TaxID=196159 RepID=UPI0008374778|nr:MULTISPECIES: endonuclease/exonuclease/phosphatase family protein [unclassified Sphingomonas]